MVSPSNIVQGSIVANVNSLQQPGFGIPLILGNTSSTIPVGGFEIFTNMIGVSAIFASSDPEYLAAQAVFSQNPTVTQIFIGRELARVAQISTLTFSGPLVTGTAQVQTVEFSSAILSGQTAHITVNGTVINQAFDTDNATTLAALAVLIDAVSGVASAVSDGTDTITVTGAVTGVPVVLTAATVTGPALLPTITITQTVAPVLSSRVTGTINNTSVNVPFDTSNAQTLINLATALTLSGVTTAVSNGTNMITITSAVAGAGFVLTAFTVTGAPTQPTVVAATGTSNVGLLSSLTSIANVNNNFYAIIWTERNVVLVANAFAVIEATDWFYMTSSNDTGILNPATTTDIASVCQDGNYGRSAVWYSATANTQYLEAAVFGKNLPNPPGKVNWAFTQLNGVTADNLTQTQYAAALAKNCNVFVPFANVQLTYKGTCGSGLYIDLRIGIDWTNSSMVTALFNAISQLTTGSKVPYTDAGVDILKNAMYGVLQQGSQNQFIVGGIRSSSNPNGYIVGSVPVADIPDADVAARYYPSLTFEATFEGAIDSVRYAGVISLP